MKKLAIVLVLTILLSGCGKITPNNKSTPEAKPTVTASGQPEKEIDLEKTAKALVTDLSEEKFEEVQKNYVYDAKMSQLLDENFLKNKLWGELIRTYGKFIEISEVTAGEISGYRVVDVTTSFEKGKVYIKVIFDKESKIAGLNYAPYAESSSIIPANADTTSLPSDIAEKEISFGKPGFELTGTLTTPKHSQDYPVVIFVHGSGPNDRDETIGPNKPFRDLAWGLAQKGIASLRYDKRTRVHAAKMDITKLTVYEETVEDAGLAVQFLKSNNVTSGKLFIIGHSLGGMLMPRIADETKSAFGYIIMAGCVTPLEDLYLEQITYISGLDEGVSKEEQQTIDMISAMRSNIKNLKTTTDFTSDKLLGTPASYWLDLKDYNPAKKAKSIEKPLLILQGERDYQVTMREFDLWKADLKGKKNVSFKSYSGLNHLFIEGTGKPSPQEYEIAGKVDARVINDISSWINNQI